MQINPSKFMAGITVLLCIAMVGYSFYFLFGLFFLGPKVEDAPTLATVNIAVLGPKVQKAAQAITGSATRVALKKKDIAFIESALYKSFTDIPDGVPLSDSRGRPDPFVPYVAP